jgi:3D (Asp-Asp-Asp) domain-containing protein
MIFLVLFLSNHCAAKSSQIYAKITYYWTASFNNVYCDDDEYALKNVKQETIAKVPTQYAAVLWTEGAGFLADGRLVNLVNCENFEEATFMVVDQNKFPCGLSSTGTPLVPLKTVAVDKTVIPLGSSVYIPNFRGLNHKGETHDGCFIATDTGHSCKGKHIDIFVNKKESYLEIEKNADTYGKDVEVIINSDKCK